MRFPARALCLFAIVSVLCALVLAARAPALPLYAGRTGLMCQSCHFDPNGGGPRNDFGFAFAKNRHRLTPDTSGAWKDLDLTNRIGDRMPVYLGLNQRFMLLATRRITSRNIDDLAFFNMENGIHIAFQPHSRLTLVYTMDAFSNQPGTVAGNGGPFRSKEAFGMIGGFPWDGYVKAGRIRTPFGLRMDDHTVATRDGYVDPIAPAFMPYDVRESDMGVEVGADKAGFFGRAAFTNGQAGEFTADPYAEAKTVKLGYNHPWFQVAASLFDDFHKTGSDPTQRNTRWGAYGLTHWRDLVLLGEVAAGTDRFLPGGSAVHNLLAWFAEADYAPTRWANVRARYDYLVTDRESDPVLRNESTYRRYALEGELVPVPFAELRWTLRYIDPRSTFIPGDRQAYLQMHFSY